MKRILILFLCLMLLPTVAIRTALANDNLIDGIGELTPDYQLEDNGTQVDGNAVSFQITAMYRIINELPKFPVSGGEAGGTLPDGSVIDTENAPTGAAQLVVRMIPKTDTAPYTWFFQVLAGKGSVLQAYEIFYLDADGNRLDAQNTRITLSVPEGMDEPKAHSVQPSGSNLALTTVVSGGNVSFTTNGSWYYVLAGTGFEEYRDSIIEQIDELHRPDETDVRKEIIDAAKKAAEDYVYDPDKTYDENKAALDEIREQVKQDVAEYDDFEAYREKIKETIDGLHEIGEDAVRKDRIDEAMKAVEDYVYNRDKTGAENKAELDKILEALKKDLEDLEKFEDYRDKILDAIDDQHKSGESASRKEKIDKAEQAVRDYVYDFDKTLAENQEALYKILDRLCKDLEVKTPKVPKTGDEANLQGYVMLAIFALLVILLLVILLMAGRNKKRFERSKGRA